MSFLFQRVSALLLRGKPVSSCVRSGVGTVGLQTASGLLCGPKWPSYNQSIRLAGAGNIGAYWEL